MRAASPASTAQTFTINSELRELSARVVAQDLDKIVQNFRVKTPRPLRIEISSVRWEKIKPHFAKMRDHAGGYVRAAGFEVPTIPTSLSGLEIRVIQDCAPGFGRVVFENGTEQPI